MRNRSTRRVSLVNWLCLGIMTVLLAGCFQSAGNNLEPTSVDLVALTLIATQQRELSPTPFVTAIPSEGFTPPTLTSIPTATEPPTLTPIPTETPTVAITEVVEPTSSPPTEVTALPELTPELTTGPVVTETLTPSETPSLSVVLSPSPTALPGDAPCMHTVQVGEWLYSIARKYNINPVDLIAVNPGSDNRTLQPGDVIRIPNCNQPTPTAVPPTQPAAGGVPGEMPTPIPLIDRVYTVAAGDTLGGIARKFGVTVQMLKDANGLTSDFLRIGQQLKIPESQE
jgi:LysM repeat protein